MLLKRTDLTSKGQRVRLVALALLGMIAILTTDMRIETLYPSEHTKFRYHWKRQTIPPGMVIRGFFFYRTRTDGPEGSWTWDVRTGNTVWELEIERHIL
jgi:hypothetical protein